MRIQSINDSDRAQWIDNDENLYGAWRASRQTQRVFIRENRKAIDAHIALVLS